MTQDDHSLEWKPYDPTWLVQLAEEQAPERPWLSIALSKCTKGRWDSPAYVRFVEARNANQPESEWQFEENIILEHPEHGDLVLDILKEHRVGGMEFLSRVLGSAE